LFFLVGLVTSEFNDRYAVRGESSRLRTQPTSLI
jgi:hypothetical protein